MSAIYQRARPVRWEDVVGQEHVKDVLKAALEQGRVGHAYLFSGPRGVGKTTTARLIAMTANCTGPLPKPCGECDSCLSVRAGSHPDVMEIDAASNNSVDDVRDLREKVSLAAMHGGKKIYILDEAHMMSRAAFNALLKTLEEPPSHVIFILATTEPEKIIPTILSRCQHYRFRRLTPEEIAGKLGGLVQREGARAEPDALHLIGRLADGAMRDGESLLERMLAAGTAITRAGVEDALGLPPGERVRGIAAALVGGDAGAAISGAAALYRDGFAARTVVEGLVAALGAALHAELGLKDTGPEARLDGADVPRLLKLQAALDEQESRFARAADQQSLELALTHALLAADASSGAAGRPAAGAATGPAASVPADLTQRLNRLEKELASLRARPAGGPVVSAPVADFDPGAVRSVATQPVNRQGSEERRLSVAVSHDLSEAELHISDAQWKQLRESAAISFKPFIREAKVRVDKGVFVVELDSKWTFHTNQLVDKFQDLCDLIWKTYPNLDVELITSKGVQKSISKSRDRERVSGGTHVSVQNLSVAAVGELHVSDSSAPLGKMVQEIAPFEPVRAAARRAAPSGPVQTSPAQSGPVQSAVQQDTEQAVAAVAPSPSLVAALPPARNATGRAARTTWRPRPCPTIRSVVTILSERNPSGRGPTTWPTSPRPLRTRRAAIACRPPVPAANCTSWNPSPRNPTGTPWAAPTTTAAP
ncbi:DNA polymerase III subunit gamma/tau [Deinococcus aquaticus]|uniref:DNA polymerase III subunit gamma/tau n=1 Tax=Deinococcus aquaticus TaxID=328692 RepID=UPI003614BB6E